MFPTLRVPTAELTVLNGSAGGAAVAQQYQIGPGATGRRTLLQSGLKCTLQIRASTKFARADEIQSSLHGGGLGRKGSRLKSLDLIVEQQQIETVSGVQGEQQALQNLI